MPRHTKTHSREIDLFDPDSKSLHSATIPYGLDLSLIQPTLDLFDAQFFALDFQMSPYRPKAVRFYSTAQAANAISDTLNPPEPPLNQDFDPSVGF